MLKPSEITPLPKLVFGGDRPADLPRGYFLQPTVFTDVPLDSALWREEIFGPVLCVRSFSSEAKAIALATDSQLVWAPVW